MIRSVLISGAGIAGPTLAYWLARGGYRPTVVERGAKLRSSGSPVDVRGAAVGVAERMGITPRLRDAAIQIDELRFVDGAGRRRGGFDMRAFRGSAGDREVELFRSDLGSILYDASRSDAEYVFGDSIVELHEEPDGVVVTFERAPARKFDLVIGADGLHSAVRRIAFGPEDRFVEHIGMYVATVSLGTAEESRVVMMYNAPGRAVAIHPARGRAVAAFIFRAPEVEGLDYDDAEQHAEIVARAYSTDRWRVPELLARVRETDDLYFDAICKVMLPDWSRGRVALVGDAGSCVSLFGDGSSSAITGAHALATALAEHPNDHRAAFRRYEAVHRRVVDPRINGLERSAWLMVPATRSGIAARNLASRLSPVVAGVVRVARTLGG